MLTAARPLQAVFILEQAVKENPGDLALLRHLARVKARAESAAVHATVQEMRVGGLYLVVYALMPWILLLASLAVGLGVPLFLLELTGQFSGKPSDQPAADQLKFLLVLCICVLGGALLAWRMFLLFWFKFLRLLPASHALEADSCIGGVMQVSSFGDSYWCKRKEFFADRYGA